MNRLITGIIPSILVMLTDQVSKLCAAAAYGRHGEIAVSRFCNIVQVWNSGISFGMFDALPHGNMFFVCLTGFVVVMLVLYLVKAESARSRACLSVIVGGAMGNLLDRIRCGAVHDFIDVHVYGFHWPAFNVADASVVCGVLCLLLVESMSCSSSARIDQCRKL